MSENIYNLRAGYYYNYTGICKNSEENLTTNEVVDLLNEQEEKINQLKKELSQIKETFQCTITQNYTEDNKDEIHIKDSYTEIHIKNGRLCLKI